MVRMTDQPRIADRFSYGYIMLYYTTIAMIVVVVNVNKFFYRL